MALIDPTRMASLRELAGGDAAFLAAVIDAFLPQLDTGPEALRAALERGEARAVAQLAHSLKGSAANVGAEEVERLAVEIEGHARGGDLEAAGRLLDELGSAAERTRRAYEAEKARGG